MADPDRKFLSLRRVMALLDVSRSTVLRLVEQGRLPQPHRLTGNVLRWLACDVESFIYRVAAGQYEQEPPPPEGGGTPPEGEEPPEPPPPDGGSRRKK